MQEGVHKMLRALSNAQLEDKMKAIFPSVTPAQLDPLSRKQRIKVIVDLSTAEFKREWEKQYGWPFDDCYDSVKLRAHVSAMKDKAKQAEFPLNAPKDTPLGEVPPTDLTKIYTPDGMDELPHTMTRAEFDQLSEPLQKEIRAFHHARVLAVIRSGNAGVLGEKAGLIVDRRLHPEAIPIPGHLKPADDPALPAE